MIVDENIIIMEQEQVKPLQQVAAGIERELAQGNLAISDSKVNLPLQRSTAKPNEIQDANTLRRKEEEREKLQRKLYNINRSITEIKEKKKQHKKDSPDHSQELNDLKNKDREIRERIMRDRQRIRQKKEAEINKHRQLKLQESISMRQQNENRRRERKMHILESVQAIKEKMTMRQQFIKQHHQAYLQVKNKQELYQRIEEEEKNKEQQLLEERKRKLAEIRSLHQPIDSNSLIQHQLKFQQIHKQKQHNRSLSVPINNSPVHVYKSSFYRKVIQAEAEAPPDESRIKLQKMKAFQSHVKQNFIPSIDQSKRRSIEDIVSKQQQKKRDEESRAEKDRIAAEHVKQIGKGYLKSLRDINCNSQRNSSREDHPREDHPKREDHHRENNTPRRIVYTNYLTHSSSASPEQNWSRILSSTATKKEKVTQMHFQAEKQENRLRMKEQKARLTRSTAIQDIDQEYFSMIKAKLDLLSQ